MNITISDLEFEAIIGILDFERDRTQKVRLNIVIEYDYIEPNFIDYSKIVEISKKHIISKKYKLLEDALEGLKETLMEHFPDIKDIRLSISKPDILPDCTVTLSI